LRFVAEKESFIPHRITERRDDMRSATQVSGKKEVERSLPPLAVWCSAVLSILASLFAPAVTWPIHGMASTPPYTLNSTVTVASIDPTVISIGDMKAGDNWPGTWADDDNVYTYIADGTGFGLPNSVSMSPAKIFGDPSDGKITGQNISTNAVGKARGSGPNGRKVSGLISVPDPTSPSGHALYAWVRNISRNGGASLMYSYDHAVTWAWAWGNPGTTPAAIIPELGYPTWMQAGKNTAAAQDNYLYFYSQNAPTAYQVTDTVILGRVDRAHVKVKSAYQYFAGWDGNGNPKWTADIALRKPVFTAPGQCYRVFVTYHPILKQDFLLTADGDSLDSNWRAGHLTHNLGIYAAPTPWGPWHTVYHNDHFQTTMNVFAPQMVSKWISTDGKSFYLLYSSDQPGPYRFNLQKVNLQVDIFPPSRFPRLEDK
jgi:hypothetical protein